MKARNWSSIAYGIGGAFLLAGTIAVGYFGVCLNSKPDVIHARLPVLDAPFDWGRAAAPIALLIAWALIVLGKCMRAMTGTPRNHELVRDCLEAMRKLGFADRLQSSPVDHHRVTLFKAVACKYAKPFPWPRKHWLVPYERTSHLSRKTNVAFRITDRSDDSEGVAGETWSRQAAVMVNDLPSLETNHRSADFKQYAERSFMDEETVRRKRPRARSLCGIPVEVAGRPWGVIVLDSRHPEKIEAAPAFIEMSAILGRLL